MITAAPCPYCAASVYEQAPFMRDFANGRLHYCSLKLPKDYQGPRYVAGKIHTPVITRSESYG